MRKKKKRNYQSFMAWEYKEEIEFMNQKSVEGWQMIKGGSLGSTYEYDTDVKFRYELDYNPNIEDRMRYMETFREQGWEYINSTFNGWHYFRKYYNPELPEDEYKIYTDPISMLDIIKRFRRMVLIVLIMLLALIFPILMHTIYEPSIKWIPYIILYSTAFILLIGGMFTMNKDTENIKKRKKKHSIIPLFAVILIAFIAQMYLLLNRAYYSGQTSADEFEISNDEHIIGLGDMNVHYPDNYYMELKMDNENAMNFIIENESGDIVYQCDEKQIDEDRIKLKLKKGTYNVYLHYSQSTQTGKFYVEYCIK